ncbi:MAG: hypothetical protein FLDDKLPJ_00024 [Phycisphaerae bacterium]|nr:hypothetical protein [Phycisphaerae bacterium]
MLAIPEVIALVLLGSGEPPELLQQAECARRAFQTAEIEWSFSSVYSNSKRRRQRSQFAGPDQYRVDEGFDNGCYFIDEEMAIGNPYVYSPRHLLMSHSSGEKWSWTEDATIASIHAVSDDRSTPIYDLRNIGFGPNPILDSESGAQLNLEDVTSYEVYAEEYPPRVKGVFENGAEVNWYLEPAFDHQPVRVTLGRDGHVTNESVTAYAEFDGLWFPQRIEFIREGETWMTFEVNRAEFDRPEHPRTLTPASMGMPVGTQVKSQRGVQFWDGDTLITVQEAHERHASGELDFSEVARLSEAASRGDFPGRFPSSMSGDHLGLAGVPRRPAIWEEYVRRFIQVFGLKGEQTVTAWELHKKWKDRADVYMKDHAKRLMKIEQAIQPLLESQENDVLIRLAALKRERDELLAPIQDEMFLKGLRPELFRIPTQKQKQIVLDKEGAAKGSSGLHNLARQP